MRRSGCCQVIGCSGGTRGIGRASRPRASRCCTSPNGMYRSAPIRCSSRRTHCGPSTCATRRWSSGRSATRRTPRRSMIRPRHWDARTGSRPRSHSTWSGTRRANPYRSTMATQQSGVAHGVVDVAGRGRLELVEVAAHRWHRWTSDPAGFGPVVLPTVVAHTNVRTSFAFPDGSTTDLVVTPDGWRERDPRRR